MQMTNNESYPDKSLKTVGTILQHKLNSQQNTVHYTWS